jgi:AcrR family transcriptional regulator
MTKAEIIEAAFKVWARELYLNTSLSHVARELKVCKPALYRHFRNKQALLEAMTMHFCDDFAGFIRADYEKALKNIDGYEDASIMTRITTEYFARNVEIFIFLMIKLHDRQLDISNIVKQLQIRGINLAYSPHSGDFQSLEMRLIYTTLIFFMAGFHSKRNSLVNSPSEAAILNIIDIINSIIGKGLGYKIGEINGLNYEGLESRIAGTINNIEDDPLLKAVAGAVAEAGPWEASMEQVARRSGLSKSSLYGHFKNKQDMLHQLFMSEMGRIIDFAKQGIRQSAVPQEQLYLGIFSIVEYLRAKPDFLVALDWIRNRRISLKPAGNLDDKPLQLFQQLFEEINIKPLKEAPLQGASLHGSEDMADESWLSPWILFLVVNTLLQGKTGLVENVPNSDIRFLHRFLTLGIGGYQI